MLFEFVFVLVFVFSCGKGRGKGRGTKHMCCTEKGNLSITSINGGEGERYLY